LVLVNFLSVVNKGLTLSALYLDSEARKTYYLTVIFERRKEVSEKIEIGMLIPLNGLKSMGLQSSQLNLKYSLSIWFVKKRAI